MSLGTATIRYLLHFINLLFVITGIVIISVGISTKLLYRDYELLIEKQYVYLPIILVIIGVTIFLIAVIGLCGAIYENSFVTLMFSSLLLLVFFLEITVGLSGYLLKNTTQHALVESMTLKNAANDIEVKKAWDKVQGNFNCCGIFGPEDWNNITNNELPHSCCTQTERIGTIKTIKREKSCTMKSRNLNREGCFNEVEDFIKSNSFTIELVGFILAFFQLIGIGISCHLSSEFRKGYQTV